MKIPEISLKMESIKIRGRSRALLSNKWVDLEAQNRMNKITKIINKIK